LIKMIEPEPRIINIIQSEDRRALIMACLHHYYEPDTTVEQIRMQQRAPAYQIVGNDLYKVSYQAPSFAALAKKRDIKY
jgi:hypothetical protein